MRFVFNGLLAINVLIALNAAAEIRTETIEYRDGDIVLEGYLAYDAKLAAKRPGILVVHDYKGVRDIVKKKVEDLAKLGYTAFAADIYGKGIRPKDGNEAMALVTKYKNDRPLLRRRTELALKELSKHKTVNGTKLAAMGYCFGGTAALELGRTGADLKGIVSFHGGLDTPNPQDGKNIKGRVLVLHGADDPYVKPEEVKAFENEMRAGKVDWELTMYSNAVHAFTIPDAGNDNSKGAAYNAQADKRSWQAMKTFFSEIF